MNDAPLICGVDEAGRGPLAGPVFAAAVILNPSRPIVGLADSKVLSPKKREMLSIEIKEHALDWAIASASVEEIDQINILQASLLAMKRAIDQLKISPLCIRVDGRDCPKGYEHLDMQAVIDGDKLMDAISAASILAKTARDQLMLELHRQYPLYGFCQHKGYPTKQHLEALALHGVCQIHRKTFRPVAALLA